MAVAIHSGATALPVIARISGEGRQHAHADVVTGEIDTYRDCATLGPDRLAGIAMINPPGGPKIKPISANSRAEGPTLATRPINTAAMRKLPIIVM